MNSTHPIEQARQPSDRHAHLFDRHGSTRINIQQLVEQYERSNRFCLVARNNAINNSYIEVQSKAGFIEDLRRFVTLTRLARGDPVAQVAHACGTSLRSVQRLKKSNGLDH